ncbi:hypothetical protein BpHYR1_018909 [Brachionus plicatilis]|uniref:Uncharacterized protein n=1 Tax=Brachionus plicatilis TaxID=10195 RepID=A0A3M7R031_BRAPC|nr:hypothetical protein BpHYR1_018909 [Brachionus plicatilis]
MLKELKQPLILSSQLDQYENYCFRRRNFLGSERLLIDRKNIDLNFSLGLETESYFGQLAIATIDQLRLEDAFFKSRENKSGTIPLF